MLSSGTVLFRRFRCLEVSPSSWRQRTVETRPLLDRAQQDQSGCPDMKARALLVMEAGIHPVFIEPWQEGLARATQSLSAAAVCLWAQDSSNLRLWEMRPYLGSSDASGLSLQPPYRCPEMRTLLGLPRYVLLAERLGYVVNVVEPWEICAKWPDGKMSGTGCTCRHMPTERPALHAGRQKLEGKAD